MNIQKYERRANLDVDRADGEEHDEDVADAGDPAIEASAHVGEEGAEPRPEDRHADDFEVAEGPVVVLGLEGELFKK